MNKIENKNMTEKSTKWIDNPLKEQWKKQTSREKKRKPKFPYLEYSTAITIDTEDFRKVVLWWTLHK